MPLQLYDTFTRITQPVIPHDGKTLRFYCCGPTVYGPAHIGNFRTFVMQDIFRRVVEVTGTPTRHVRNITDVDDKTIRKSQEEGCHLSNFTNKWTERFHEDCSALGLLTPHIEPSAVAHIPDQIDLITKLIDKGHAYRNTDGSVYFDVRSFPAYGKLSRLADREITSHTIDREQNDEYSRNSAADFVLWKASRPEDGLNRWESPWGHGRPGWHIECSAMAMRHLGETFDLHSGGIDLIFPHNENEISQSEAVTGKKFSHHWFHVAHLTVEGRKMSKSLDNLYTLTDLSERGYTPMELRYVLLSGNYRQTLNFTFSSLDGARKALSRLRYWQERFGEIPDGLTLRGCDFGPFLPVYEALLSDLNTSEALGRLHSIGRRIITNLESGGLSILGGKSASRGLALVLHILGIVLTNDTQSNGNEKNIIPAEIKSLATERLKARQAGNWILADKLREKIRETSWCILDSEDSYTLERRDL